jgi:hypothetical protein
MTALEREKCRRKAKKARGKGRKKVEAKTKAEIEALELLGEDASEAEKPGKSNKRTLAEADGLLSNALGKVKASHESRPMKDSDDENEEWQKHTPRLF